MTKTITLFLFLSMLTYTIAQNKPNFNVSGFIHVYELKDSCKINYELYNEEFIIINRDSIFNDSNFSSGDINFFFKIVKSTEQLGIKNYTSKNVDSKIYLYESSKKDSIINYLNKWNIAIVEEAKSTNKLDMFIFEENKPFKNGVKIVFKKVYKEVNQEIIKFLVPKNNITGELHINYTLELTVLSNEKFKYRFYDFYLDKYRLEKYLLFYKNKKAQHKIIQNVKSDIYNTLNILMKYLERINNHYAIIKINEDNFDILEKKLL